MPSRREDDFINTLVGEGTAIKGDLETRGQVRIDGDFSGTITTHNKVLLSGTGRVKANITAREVVIGGVVKGDVLAREKIVLLPTGLVIGKLSSPVLEVASGALLEGVCHITPQVTDSRHPAFHHTDYYTVKDTLAKDRISSDARPQWNP